MASRPASALAFLARLAPDAPAGVRAALPSRFAPDVAASPVESAPVPTAAAPSPSSRDLPARAKEPVEGRQHAAAPPRLVPQPPHAASVPPARVIMPSPLGDVPARPFIAPERTARAPARWLSVATADTPAAPPGQPSTAGAAPAATVIASVPLPIAPVRAPLREAALAQRPAMPHSAPPPAVHVTIDRIDVRVPAATPATVTSPSRPASAGTVPLGDYLRGRGRAGPGDPP